MNTTLTDQARPADDAQPAEQTGPETGPAPTTGRPELPTVTEPTYMNVPVAVLTAHPGNTRTDLRLSKGFIRSVKAKVRVPLNVTQHDDGTLTVTMGMRRLAAAVEAGRETVPCLVCPAGAPAEAFLDMAVENTRRENFTAQEEAAALFSAREAGYSASRIARETGRTASEVKAGLTAAALPEDIKAAASDTAEHQWTLLQLAELDEFAGDYLAVDRITRHASRGQFDYGINLEREQRADEKRARDEQARLRAELDSAGVNLIDALPDGASDLWKLSDADGNRITAETHASCPGHRARFSGYDGTDVTYLCIDPASNGHTDRTARAFTANGQPAPAGTDAAATATANRRRTIAGNRHWRAATTARHAFLTGVLARKTTPKQVSRYVAGQLLNWPYALACFGSSAQRTTLLSAVLQENDFGPTTIERLLATAPDRRLPLLQLAVIGAAHEAAINEFLWRGRPDSSSGAARWFAFLATIGHQLSPIEQAIADGQQYEPLQPPGDADRDGSYAPAAGDPGPADPAPDEDPQPVDSAACPACGADPGTACGTTCAAATAKACDACNAEPGETCRPGCISRNPDIEPAEEQSADLAA